MRITSTILALSMAAATPAIAALPADPLNSPMWTMQAARIFGLDPVVFDDAVKITLPMIAENQHVFPLTLDARALGKVQRIVVFEDLNPIPVSVDFMPQGAAPWLSLRIKLDQRTPVRVAALDAQGRWHVSGGWVDAAGGGCSAPPVSRARGDWADHLGELRGALSNGVRKVEDFARRYRLERAAGSDLEIQVADRDMGDEVRSVHSLSGGETFLISLALALGLSAMAGGGAGTATLFIDEGFGTLDEQTLDEVLGVLDALRDGGRAVGIVASGDRSAGSMFSAAR